VALFDGIFSMPVVLMGFGLPGDNLHAPNEKIHLPNFYRGTETAIHYYDLLGRQSSDRPLAEGGNGRPRMMTRRSMARMRCCSPAARRP
jgi:hypothetical protein